MTVGKQQENIQIKLGGEILQQVTQFVYLRGTLAEDEMHRRYKKKNWVGMCSLRETR